MYYVPIFLVRSAVAHPAPPIADLGGRALMEGRTPPHSTKGSPCLGGSDVARTVMTLHGVDWLGPDASVPQRLVCVGAVG